MKKFMNFLKRNSKKLGLLVGVTAVVALGAAAASAWGPDRTTYTVENPADHITFNSITNNPNVGDEREFVSIKDAANTNDGGWRDSVTVEPGKEYLVRVYAHNNAATSLNLTALNTRVKANVPTTTGKNVMISGFVSADNAQPKEVWDDIKLSSTQNFNIAYVPGSARIYNNGYAAGGAGKPLPDSIVTSAGAQIGYNGADGKVPGCFQYANYVYFKVKPQFAAPNTYKVEKSVRKSGTTEWTQSVAAKAGDKVDYLVKYQNTGQVMQDKVVVVDKLPNGMTLVPNSTFLKNSNHPGDDFKPANQTGIVDGGLSIGNHTAGSGSYVKFSALVPAEAKLLCGPNTLKNWAYGAPAGSEASNDDADVTVTKECQPNTPEFTIVKDVRKKGDTEWKQDVSVEYGDTVQYRILVKNTGDTDLKKVLVKDNRPTGVDYVNGTLKVNGKTSTEDLFKNGVTIPEIKKGATAEITFDAKVNKGQTAKCEVKKFRNIASAKPEGLQPKEDDANVNTKCNVTPAYECSAVETLALGGNKYRFTVRVKTEGGAKVNKYIYNFGDATPELSTDKNVTEHQYAKPGEYSVVVRVLFNVGNEQKEARCTSQVVIPVVPTTPPTSSPVTSIPSTGPAELAAGIFGTSATAYGVFAWVGSRRALKNVK
ncbi:DUF11 domain-containing protein [Candidatus Saccharibacteria bacterium]|nr:DUF11 domain-containing protein [Candidatus Saccharibacteria bacterium]